MKIKYQFIAVSLFFLTQAISYGQLGFCTGSKGDPVFKENFGSGTNYGPALPFGTTNYAYVSSGFPQDGQYTLFYRTNLIAGNWLYSLDHTSDTEVDGINGKSLIVNASNVSGEFYKKIVSGLCINTTFEFTAWAINIYNSNSNGCSGTGIPVNIKFEIWDATETILLKSGDTGNINGTSIPIWTQFGLVFTTTSQTSVVLKMKNNGTGGCGNDLAIDDIMFRSCGDFTTVTSPLTTGNSYTVCQNSGPINSILNAVTSGTTSHVYQWQESLDGINWTSITGANSSTYTTPGITTNRHYRAKVAQDIANLNNSYCSTISEEFDFVFDSPLAPQTGGDKTICFNDPIPNLAVTSNSGEGVNWYDASTGGNLVQSNSPFYTPSLAGTFYAESFSVSSNCKSVNRTPVSLTILPQLNANISAAALSICSGTSTTISINGTPNAIVSYTVDGGANQTISLGTAGTAVITTPLLNVSSSYTFSSISVTYGTTVCNKNLTDVIPITVFQSLTASILGATTICSGSITPVTFSGTPNSELTYNINNGVNQTLLFDASGTVTLNSTLLYADTTYTLVQVASQGTSICTKSLSDAILIKVNALPTANITGSTSICAGSSAQISITGTPNSTLTYTIDNGSNQTYSIDASGLGTINTPNLFSNSIYSFLNISTNALPTCSQLLSGSTVSITINNSPTVTYTGNTTFCSGSTSSIVLSSNSAGINFSWTVVQNGTTGAIAGIGNSINQQLQTTTDSTGTAIYNVTPILNNCSGTPISIPITVNTLPIPSIVDGAICLDQTTLTAIQPYSIDTQLNAASNSFIWYRNGILLPTVNSSVYQANVLGVYGVIVTDTTTGCSSGLVEVTVIETLPGQSISVLQTEAFSENATILVNVTGGQGPFLYQLDYGSFQSSNVFNSVTSGIHTITVIDDSNCTHLFNTITIVDYPRFFTPNNDGINDTWNIKSANSKAKITIIDRYGKVLKQLRPIDLGWDGTFNSKNLPADDYWFTIEYLEQGTTKIFKSHFTLKR